MAVLVEEMLERILHARHAHVDETTLPVLAPGKTKKSYVWSVVGGRDAPYSVYRFTTGRGREGPDGFLEGFKGILQTDAYTVYKTLSNGSRRSCGPRAGRMCGASSSTRSSPPAAWRPARRLA